MSNYALIIAGGSGNRMGQDIPKQFMYLENRPIIIHTMEAFQQHPDINAIAVVCLEGWETVLQSYANQFNISKLKWIFPGGKSGQESIHNGIYGLKEAGCKDEDLVLIHDAVRPLLSQTIISSNIAICKKYGYGIVRDLAGHGVGLQFHEDPEVNHYGHRGTGMLLVPGMVFTIEPMINMGTWRVFIDADDPYGWEVITEDEKPSAQWEHTLVMTDHGVEILTY